MDSSGNCGDDDYWHVVDDVLTLSWSQWYKLSWSPIGGRGSVERVGTGSSWRGQPGTHDWDSVLGSKVSHYENNYDFEFDPKLMMTTVINIAISAIIFIMPRCRNLESLFEQMKAATTIHMASILNVTDSAYYPCFRFGWYFSRQSTWLLSMWQSTWIDAMWIVVEQMKAATTIHMASILNVTDSASGLDDDDHHS